MKRKKKSLVRKLSFGRFRGSTAGRERHRPEGGDSSRSHSQSSSQESPNRPWEGETAKVVEKGTKQQRPLSTVTVVQRKSPSLTIGCSSQQQQLLKGSVLTSPQPELNLQADLRKKLLLLEERRAFFKKRATQPISSLESGSDSSLDNSGKTIVDTRACDKNLYQEYRRPARHISVRKFDTFSTFEGTFDEDTGLGYLAGIEEDHPESCEDAGMPTEDASQDSSVNIFLYHISYHVTHSIFEY